MVIKNEETEVDVSGTETVTYTINIACCSIIRSD
jgi:hypothetical protein